MAVATVTVRGTPEAPILDFDIPAGETGPAGGITLGALLTSIDLDTILASGVYRQDDGSKPSALLHYPIINTGGILLVFERVSSTSVQQIYYPHTRAELMFKRTYSSGVWTAWKTFPSTRVDQTAGRAFYQWDELNNREQLVYGDTGWRDVNSSLINGASSGAKLRRVGSTCDLTIVGWVPPSNGANVLTANLPAGYATIHTRSFAALDNTLNALKVAALGSSGMVTISGNVTTSSYNLAITWTTIDAWPSTLPGTAFASIPYL